VAQAGGGKGRPVEISLKGIVVIVGNYGSGKSEVAINLAANRRQAGIEVSIADLDLVNPYFRTREARAQLTDLGIDVVLPPEKYLQADLPILTPAIAGLIRQPNELSILDVGGDKVGATVLAALGDAFDQSPIRMIQVVNPLRPDTDTIERCLKIRAEIEDAANQPITGIIGNANLIDETSVDEIYNGYEFTRELSTEGDLSLEFITVAEALLPEIDMQRIECAVLPIRRQLLPPWQHARKLGGE
jgi:hypothetical protein